MSFSDALQGNATSSLINVSESTLTIHVRKNGGTADQVGIR